MANIFGGVEPPSWLQEIAKPIDTKQAGSVLGLALAGLTNAARGDMSFAEGVNIARKNIADPQWQTKEAIANARTIAALSQAQTATNRLNLQMLEEAAWMRDVPVISEWMQRPIEQQLKEPLGGLQSKRGVQIASQYNRTASASAQAQALEDSKASYDKRVAEIIKADPAAGVGLALQPGQFPNEYQIRNLELAEERVQIRRGSRAAAAEIQALRRGDQITTTITEKGDVRTQFKPPGARIEPELLTLRDGTEVIFNPNSGRFTLKNGNREKELSPNQLESIAKEIKTSDPDNAKLIMDYLTKVAKGQIEKPTSRTPSTSAPSRGGFFKEYESWRKEREKILP